MVENKNPDKKNDKKEETQAVQKLNWIHRKQMHVDSLTNEELQRIIKEREAEALKQAKSLEEMNLATKEADKRHHENLCKHCTSGSPEERLAKALIRIGQKGLLSVNPTRPDERLRDIVELLRLHNISIRDGKEKLTPQDYEEHRELFVSDLFVHRIPPFEMRRTIFSGKENSTESVGGEQ